MRLNRWEFLSMNNPIRKWAMRRIEFDIFRRMLFDHQVDLNGKIILDAACGSAFSSTLIHEAFYPDRIISFDFMPEQVSRIPRETGRYRCFLGNVLQLGLKDQKMDVVFGFGFLHHVLDWRQAVCELARVTKAGGYIILEEPNGAASEFFRKYVRFAIPQEGQFSWRELESEFSLNGFRLLEYRPILLDCFRAYLFRKQPMASGMNESSH